MSRYRLAAIPFAAAAGVLAIARMFALAGNDDRDPLLDYQVLAGAVAVVLLLFDTKPPTKPWQRVGACILSIFTLVSLAAMVFALYNGARTAAIAPALSAVAAGGGAWYVYRQSCR